LVTHDANLKSWPQASDSIERVRNQCYTNLFRGIHAHTNANTKEEINQALHPAIIYLDQFIAKIKSIIDNLSFHKNTLVKQLEEIEKNRLEDLEKERLEKEEEEEGKKGLLLNK
jgi:hypothetical protein